MGFGLPGSGDKRHICSYPWRDGVLEILSGKLLDRLFEEIKGNKKKKKKEEEERKIEE